MKCKICGQEEHFCSSCCYDEYLADGYCYEKTYEHEFFSTKIINFWENLSHEQKLELWSLWDNKIFEDEKWKCFLNKTIINTGMKRELSE